jgi:hypothetical protein
MNSKKMNKIFKNIFDKYGVGQWLIKEYVNTKSLLVQKRNAKKKIKDKNASFVVESTSNVFTMSFESIEAQDLLPCDIIINKSGQMLEVDYIEESNGLFHVTFLNNDSEIKEIFEANTVMGFVDNLEELAYNEFNEKIEIFEDGNKKVKLNKIMKGDVKKYKVFVKNDKGNVVKVNFGDPNMEIKRDNPARRRNFRARHNCDNPGPRWKARYWACKTWSTKSVSSMLKEDTEVLSDFKIQLKNKSLMNTTKPIIQNTLNSVTSKPYNPNLYGLMNKKIKQN